MQITHVSRQTTRTMMHSVRKCIEKFLETYNSEAYPKSYQATEPDDMLVTLFRGMMVEHDLLGKFAKKNADFGYRLDDDDNLQATLSDLVDDHIQYNHHNIFKSKYEDHAFSSGTGLKRYSLASYVLRPLNSLYLTNDFISSQYIRNMKSVTYAMYLLMDDGTRQVISDEFKHLDRTIKNTVHQEFMKGSVFEDSIRLLLDMNSMMQDYMIVHVMAAYYDTVHQMENHPERPMEWQIPFVNARFMEVYQERRPALYQLLYSAMKIAPLENRRAAPIRRTLRSVLTDMLDYTTARHSLTTA